MTDPSHLAEAQASSPALRCPRCRRAMHPERRAGVSIDVCAECGMVWFDAEELDRCLSAAVPEGDPPDEADLPDRGPSTRRCPRCSELLRYAGWDAVVLDRCRR